MGWPSYFFTLCLDKSSQSEEGKTKMKEQGSTLEKRVEKEITVEGTLSEARYFVCIIYLLQQPYEKAGIL